MGWVGRLSPDLERELDAYAGHRRFRGMRHIAQDEGFAVNEKKTRVLRRNAQQNVTGIVVNDKIGVRRDAQVELLEGAAAGDKVVTAGIRVQRDGQPVRVVGAAAGAGAAEKKDALAPPTPRAAGGAADGGKAPPPKG